MTHGGISELLSQASLLDLQILLLWEIKSWAREHGLVINFYRVAARSQEIL